MGNERWGKEAEGEELRLSCAMTRIPTRPHLKVLPPPRSGSKSLVHRPLSLTAVAGGESV